MAGRKPIIINLKATSPSGEVKFFKTFKEAATELGFNESSVKKAYHNDRNRIGQYELEWLKVPEEPTKEKPERERERKERLEEACRKEALSKMNIEELVDFKRREEEERNRKDIEFNKLFDRVFSESMT